MNTPSTESTAKSYTSLRRVLEEKIPSSKLPKSPLSRMLYYWKGNPNMRIAIGFGLLGGGLVATATGSFATAGIILGARAGISALGAFTSSKGLYDLIRGKYQVGTIETLVQRVQHAKNSVSIDTLVQEIESCYTPEQAESMIDIYLQLEKKHKIIGNIIGATAASVAGVLAFHGVVEAANVSVIDTQELPKIPQKIGSNAFDVNLIADDIRHDHPKQNWISLEQMVRRVEGLRMGIGLHESEKLIPLNASVSQIVHNPQGAIAEILKIQGYPENIDIDTLARTLSERDIKEITEAYIQGTSIDVKVPLDTISGEVVLPIHSVIAPSFSEGLGILGGSMIVASGGYIGYKFMGEKSQSTDGRLVQGTINEPEVVTLVNADLENEGAVSEVQKNKVEMETLFLPEILSDVQDGVGSTAESILSSENGASLGNESLVSDEISGVSQAASTFKLSESALKIQGKIHEYFTVAYGWEIELELEKNTQEKQIHVYGGSTVSGQYQIFVTYTHVGVQTTIVWYDHDAVRLHVQSEVLSYDSLLYPIDTEFSLEPQLDGLYLEMLMMREEIKSEDMRYIRAVSLPVSHLRSIYDQMEMPQVRDKNLEVLGFWMGSAYDIHHHTLPLQVLANPPVEDQDITSVSCRLKNPDIAREYYLFKPNDMINMTFPPKESELILQKRLGEFQSGGSRMLVFSGAMRAINWHKHPDYLVHPSQGDIDEAKRDLAIQYPGAETHPYTIAVRIKESEIPRWDGDSQVVVLPRSAYGGMYSYALRSYQAIYKDGEFEEMRQLDIQLK